MKGPRAQIDRDLYRQHMQDEIRGMAGLIIREDSVEDLVFEDSNSSNSSNSNSKSNISNSSSGEGGNSSMGKLRVTGVCLGNCIEMVVEVGTM